MRIPFPHYIDENTEIVYVCAPNLTDEDLERVVRPFFAGYSVVNNNLSTLQKRITNEQEESN